MYFRVNGCFLSVHDKYKVNVSVSNDIPFLCTSLLHVIVDQHNFTSASSSQMRLADKINTARTTLFLEEQAVGKLMGNP